MPAIESLKLAGKLEAPISIGEVLPSKNSQWKETTQCTFFFPISPLKPSSPAPPHP